METMRLDAAREILGLRLNTWTSIFVLIGGIALFFIAAKVGAPTEISAAEREVYIEKVAKRNPKKAEELQEASDVTTAEEDLDPEAG